MDLKRLSPLSSSFFQKIDSSNPNPSKKEQGHSQSEEERNPTKEQVEEAVDLLNNDPEFSSKGLSASLAIDMGRYGISIFNQKIEVRKIFGHEVFTILANTFQLKENQPIVGRILDRKI
ncbi:MAG: hypothetical protein M9962_14745 [Oligoflexia bacterium]|nr:hypothetical protein [Oligoflexia bacterium]